MELVPEKWNVKFITSTMNEDIYINFSRKRAGPKFDKQVSTRYNQIENSQRTLKSNVHLFPSILFT